MNYDLKNGLYVPLENLCLLEATAAVLCEEVLKSGLDLTKEERSGLVRIKEDEANHYLLAKKALFGLRKVDQHALAMKLHDYKLDHMSRWQGPVGMISRLHEDECLVMRYLHLFEMTIIGIIPEEGHLFVEAVKSDEPRHHKWGKDILKRLIGNDEGQRRFVREQRSTQGWPAADIMRQFKRLQVQMGLRA